jgi:hypothetical protein
LREALELLELVDDAPARKPLRQAELPLERCDACGELVVDCSCADPVADVEFARAAIADARARARGVNA